jgi:hypothetical protein
MRARARSAAVPQARWFPKQRARASTCPIVRSAIGSSHNALSPTPRISKVEGLSQVTRSWFAPRIETKRLPFEEALLFWPSPAIDALQHVCPGLVHFRLVRLIAKIDRLRRPDAVLLHDLPALGAIESFVAALPCVVVVRSTALHLT